MPGGPSPSSGDKAIRSTHGSPSSHRRERRRGWIGGTVAPLLLCLALPASLLLLAVQAAGLFSRHEATAANLRDAAPPMTGVLREIPRTQTTMAAGATTAGGAGGAASPSVPFTVTTLPQSASAVDPRLAVAPDGTVYVTAPNGLLSHIGNGQSASPVWVSGNGGAGFNGPFATETASLTPTGLGGVSSDIGTDARGNAYVVTDWSGNTSTSVSADHGRTWQQLPYGHPVPIGNRAWLDFAQVGTNPVVPAPDPGDGALYMLWDGVGGIHAGKALLRPAGDGPASLLFVQDTIAVPEEPHPGVNQDVDQSMLRECVCPTGPLANTFSGRGIWFAYPSQNGVGVAVNVDGGVNWLAPGLGGLQFVIPAGVPGDPQSVSSGYPVAVGDARQDAYVVWSQYDSSGRYGIAYAATNFNGVSCPVLGGLPGAGPSTDPLSPGVGCFSDAAQVPTPPTAIYATAAVVAPGVLDIAYVAADSYRGNPATAPADTQWNVYLAQNDAPNDAAYASAFSTVKVLADIHRGPICVQPGVAGISCPTSTAAGTSTPTSLGSLISLRTDAKGLAVIAAASDHGSTHQVMVAHQTADPTFGRNALVAAAQQGDTSPAGVADFLQKWCTAHPGACPQGGTSASGSRTGAASSSGGGAAHTAATPAVRARAAPTPRGPWTIARTPAVPEHTQASPALFALVSLLLLAYLGGLAAVTRRRRGRR